MGKQGEYIKRIEIDSLWGGRMHIVWDLQRSVNILSGVNGVGKSTILNKSVHLLSINAAGEVDAKISGVRMSFYPDDATMMRYDVIRSFDRPLIHGGLLEKLTDSRVLTELDWQLYQLQRRYLDYQVNVGNRMIEMLTSCDAEIQSKARGLTMAKSRFQEIIDKLFCETGKKIDRQNNEIFFIQGDEVLSPYKLSSGEKQILVILLTVLVQNGEPYALFMDEPEASMHVEWQQNLIDLILELNPKVQIILTTHSPALVMNGWTDAVTEVSDISK